MKMLCRMLAVVVLLASVSAFAVSLDGTYKFKSRIKDGAPSMEGWSGTMTIKGNEISRNYKSADGKEEKFYVSTFTQSGDVYVMKHTKAYKPEYVGDEFKNKVVLSGDVLTMESKDGKFKEIWTK